MANIEKDPFEVAKEEIAKYDLINQKILSGDSEVQQFYDGAVIFLTGGSGFLGKHLVEKLFRSCKVKKVYLLLRSYKGISGTQRVQKIIEDPLYEYLHKTQPDFVTKIIPLNGDTTKFHCGINENIWQELIHEIDIIIHSAATINFFEPIKVAALTNVRGTQEVLNFAKACKNLRSMVHVSTAYLQSKLDTAKQTILEQFYKSPLSPECLLQLVEELDDESLDAMTPQLLQGWPNTYGLTKAIAEDLVRRSSDELPICIVRPAIVIGAAREPIGWIDKKALLNGPFGFLYGCGLGAMHVALMDEQIHWDLVPVDLVSNSILVAARETAERHRSGERDIKIYTVTTTRNASPISVIKDFACSELRSLVSPKMVWYPYVILTTNKLLFTILTYLLHFVPGYLADTVLQFLGRKPLAMRLLSKAYKLNLACGVYTTNDWKFDDQNLLKMYQRLSSTDRVIFNCDFGTIKIRDYQIVLFLGCRKHILKEDISKMNELAMRKQFWLRILHYVFIVAYTFVLWKMFLNFIYYFLGFLSVIKYRLICT